MGSTSTFLLPEQFIFWLNKLEIEPATTETTVAGYAVKVKVPKSGSKTNTDVEAVISGLVANSLTKRAGR